MSNNIEMEIESVRVSMLNYQRVVILKEKGREEGQERYLSVWVGPAEADAIAVKLQNVPIPRPLTHDLLCSLIQAFGGKVRFAVIHDLHKDTFFAKLAVELGNKNFEFDCRPSDAISVALRVNAPICANSSILDECGVYASPEGEFQGREPVSDKLSIFSETAQEALRLSEEEAKRYGCDYVKTKHLLLALGRPFNSRVAMILDSIGLQQGQIRSICESSESSVKEDNDAGLSVNVKRAIELAISESRHLSDSCVGTEHLLLSLIREQEGDAAKVLQSLGITPEKVLGELLRLYKKGI